MLYICPIGTHSAVFNRAARNIPPIGKFSGSSMVSVNIADIWKVDCTHAQKENVKQIVGVDWQR